MIVSSQRLSPGIAAPQLPQGERVLAAELSGIRQEAAAGREAQGQVYQAVRQQGEVDRQGIAAIGQGALNVGLLVGGAIRAADKQRARTDYITGLDQIEREIKDSPDYADAAKTFEERRAELEGRTFGRLFGPDGDAARAEALATTLSSRKRMAAHVAEKTASAANAAYQEGLTSQMQRAADAGSPAERQAQFDEHDKGVAERVSAGHLTAEQGQGQIRAFRRNIDIADLSRGTVKNPAAVLRQLDDPQQFASLTPKEREDYRASVQAAHDQRESLRAGERAKADPASAAATYALRFPVEKIPDVVDRGLIPQESGGNPRALSPAGAAGLTQFMPGTARMVAQQMRLDVFAGQSDEQIRQTLYANPALARDMAIFHLSDLTKRYNGSLPAALAAYNAGPGGEGKPRADAWHRQAVAQFGPEYSAAQFASIIPIAETRNYVTSIYAKLGADPGRGGLSVAATYRASNAVQGVFDEERAALKSAARDLVSEQSDQRSSLAAMYRDGYAADPAAVARIKAPLEFAAAQGDASAVSELRKLADAEAMAPMVAQAFRMGPMQREAALAEMRDQASAGTMSPDSYRRMTALETVHQKATELARSNPIHLVEREQAIPVTALPAPEAAAGPDFAKSVMLRGAAAQVSLNRTGSDMMLKPQEAAAYKQAFEAMPPGRRVEMIATVKDSLDAARLPGARTLFNGFLKQVGGDSPELQVAGLVASRDPKLATDILNGQALMGTEGYATKKADIVAAFNRALPPDAFPAGEMPKVTAAALALYANDRQGSSHLFEPSDKAGIEAATKRLVGEVVSFNGHKTVMPDGATHGRMTDAWSVLDRAMLDRIGAEPIDAGLVKDRGRLKPGGLKDGTFLIEVPGASGYAPLLGANGAPLRFSGDALWSAAQPALAQRDADRAERLLRMGATRGAPSPSFNFGSGFLAGGGAR